MSKNTRTKRINRALLLAGLAGYVLDAVFVAWLLMSGMSPATAWGYGSGGIVIVFFVLTLPGFILSYRNSTKSKASSPKE